MNLKSLIGKLNDSTRGALEAAAGFCLARTHYDIEVEHYLTKLLDSTDNDVAAIFKHFEIDTSRFSGELARALDKLKSGNARTPALSPSLMRMLVEGWTIGSIDYNAGQVRTGFTILALATHEELVRLMRDISREFQKIQPDALKKDFASIVANSAEEVQAAAAAAAAAPGAPSAGPKPGGKTPNLDQFTINLTEKAKTGKIDPVLGRDFEIRQVVDILMRRRQNNPIMSLQVGGNQMEKVTGNKSLSVTGNQSESVTGNVSLSVTGGKNDSITMSYAMTAMSIHLTGQSGIVIECPAGITLKAGASSVDVSPGGVYITGTPMAFINSGSMPAMATDPSSGSPDSPEDPKDPDTADDGSKGTKLK